MASHPIRDGQKLRAVLFQRQEPSNHQASVAPKSQGKSRSSAKASTKAASRTYAKQEKPAHSTRLRPGPPP